MWGRISIVKYFSLGFFFIGSLFNYDKIFCILMAVFLKVQYMVSPRECFMCAEKNFFSTMVTDVLGVKCFIDTSKKSGWFIVLFKSSISFC